MRSNPFKVGDRVRATGNYEDEQLGLYAPYGVQVVTEIQDGEWAGIKTDKCFDWTSIDWFEHTED